jgi:hypothetical protein
MKYALLIYLKPGMWDELSEDEQQASHAEYIALNDEPEVIGGDQLHPVEAATTVRVNDGQALTTDGPFADTKEILGGYYLVDAPDLDTAVGIAARIPAARQGGSVEVRPIVER